MYIIGMDWGNFSTFHGFNQYLVFTNDYVEVSCGMYHPGLVSGLPYLGCISQKWSHRYNHCLFSTQAHKQILYNYYICICIQ